MLQIDTDPNVPPSTQVRDRAPVPPPPPGRTEIRTEVARRRPKAWQWVLGLALVAALGGGYWYWTHHHATAKAAPPTQARSTPVATATVRKGELNLYIDGLGTATAFNTVTVRPRVDGQLVNVAYREGQQVAKGDLIAEIDPRPFQAVLEQAQGQLARDQAQLLNSQLDLKRFQDAKAAVTQQQIDTQTSVVKQYEGVVQADRAQVDSATLQLSYCRITAPISGRTGLRTVDVGNMVHASDPGGLVVLAQIQPISVVFSVPQDSIGRIMSATAAGRELQVDALSRDLTAKIASGVLQSVDNQVDPSTGTIRLKATFENKDGALFPNQFVNARMVVDTLRDVLLVPAAAVQHGPDSTFAYVVKGDDTVEMRTVTQGASQGDQVVVTSGLAEGEVVVTDGVDKLQQGSRVTVPGAAGRQKGGPGAGNGAGKVEGTPAAPAGESTGRRRGAGSAK